ncbi:zinc ribbon domain-containing protein [Methanobrevibacter sp.]|uniref:double zinc ribbon domain-containing protein n=1 Tax=Methanobrevibacter sp. TaxID=66852 RepID=UPI0025D2F618|nr:zinc ribbon domain-containing protein [Methanobrevibacter sp.]MBQ6099708.1 zinc ribbon domain-containing protein [Methanobrevibacter sp.]MBQ6513015.1 zinc ribbon domain-containing protein [Methanobrevibacter sp.]
MVICPDCGMEVPDTKFCRNCGAYLAGETQIVNVESSQTTEDVHDVKTEKKKYCSNCGFELNGDFKFCPNCGYDLKNRVVNNNANRNVVNAYEEKNIVLAIILSVIFPGLGQFYLNLNHKGIIFLIGYIVSAFLVFFVIGFLLVFVIWIWALVDTIQSTNALNAGESVEDRLF